MSLLDVPARVLLDRFASADPTPGGGSAAALGGALSAALVAMVCAMDRTRSGTPDDRERLDRAAARVREAGQRLRRLVDQDTAAYDAVVSAYRLPKATDVEKDARRKAVVVAKEVATDVPLETARECLTVMGAAVEAATHGNPSALSDARTGGALAWAGLLGAVENVRINLGPDLATQAESGINDLLRDARGLAIALGLVTT
jgi:formiminotetrahydrofolate cyclodeaminase